MHRIAVAWLGAYVRTYNNAKWMVWRFVVRLFAFGCVGFFFAASKLVQISNNKIYSLLELNTIVFTRRFYNSIDASMEFRTVFLLSVILSCMCIVSAVRQTQKIK